MSKVEVAISLFKKGFNCSQALLTAYGVGLGINREIALCPKYIQNAAEIIEEIL